MVKRLTDINLIIVVFISLICLIWVVCRSKITRKKYELVVSHYKENVDWMDDFDLSNFDVTIYMKYYTQPVKSEYRCIPLQNVGRECATYIYHIIKNYESLADIILFTLCGLSEVPHKLNKFKSVYKNYLNATKDGIVYDVEGSANNELYHFTLDDYESSTPINRNKHTYDYSDCPTCLVPASVRPYGKWAKHFLNLDIVPGVNYKWFPCGIFAVSKERILRYPKAFYEKILQELSVGDNVEAGHFLERSWYGMYKK